MLSWVLLSTLPFSLLAQVPEQPELQVSEVVQETTEELLEEIAVVAVRLPGSLQMAESVSTPEYRIPALLDLAAAANVVNRAENRTEFEVDHAVLAQGFLEDRAWIQMLVERYGWVQPHDLILDPAAWLVREELQQHDLEGASVLLRGRIPKTELLYQVFQRARERLAVANLPGLLLEVEANTVRTWEAFLALTRSQNSTHAAWKQVEDAWFRNRTLPLVVASKESAQDKELAVEAVVDEASIEDIPFALSKLASETVTANPPDEGLLKHLRLSLQERMYFASGEDSTHGADQTRKMLYLASLIDGLHEDRYFEFVQGLLSITSSLLESPVNVNDTNSLVNWLVEELPAISAHYATDFAGVDPRINSAMAASYEVLLKIANALETRSFETEIADGEITDEDASESETTVVEESIDVDSVVDGLADETPPDEVSPAVEVDVYVSGRKDSRALLANAVAQLSLLIPDMGYYFDTPLRAGIAEEINICISIAASLNEDGGVAMTRQQFDACMETLLHRESIMASDICTIATPSIANRRLSHCQTHWNGPCLRRRWRGSPRTRRDSSIRRRMRPVSRKWVALVRS
jgi:hypothetical protein